VSLNPESGREINDPITRPIPVSRNGGMLESEVARAASDAQSTIAPIAKRSDLMTKILLEWLHRKS
jgi:hypothetical protein